RGRGRLSVSRPGACQRRLGGQARFPGRSAMVCGRLAVTCSLDLVIALARAAWETLGVGRWRGHMIKAAEPVRCHAGAIVIPAAGGPTVLRILLGAQLRRLREAKRITLEDAGKRIRASHSKISRLETGRVGFKDRDIADLLTLYGVTDEEEREALRAL